MHRKGLNSKKKQVVLSYHCEVSLRIDACTFTHTCTYMCTHMHSHSHTCIYTCTYTCTHMHMYMHIYIYSYTCMHTLHAHIHTHAHIHIINISIYTYTHTHMHTCMLLRCLWEASVHIVAIFLFWERATQSLVPAHSCKAAKATWHCVEFKEHAEKWILNVPSGCIC